MILKGLQKTTLLDFPTKLACTVFTGGCNFRCPFCHNASLVLKPELNQTLPTDDFLNFLRKRRGILEGVCITGGEPLLQKDIADFIREIKALGYAVKLDTNGSFPELLNTLIESSLLDYVAMDVKSSREKYPLLTGTEKYIDEVSRSIELLKEDKVDYEFRTTVIRELHSSADFEDIGKWISGAKRYFLQLFKDSGDLIENGFSAYGEEEMKAILDTVKEYVPNAELRGMSV